ncbi:MAG TPA: hypothetical protein PLB62_05925 [Candidatus Sumerlaeota bacterium]|nr:hypothetical protein [Candidatus Sumerlaeota bacterium]
MKGKYLLLVIVLFGFAMNLRAIPGLITYQGRLTNASGQAINIPADVTFTFWDAESGGNQLGGGFSDVDTVNPDANGLFTIFIGDDPGNLVPASVFSGESVWLNISVEGTNLSPRQRMTSVGYAVKASQADTATTAAKAMTSANADMVDDRHASDFAAAMHGHSLQDLDGAVTDDQVPDSITIKYAAEAGRANSAKTAAVLSGSLNTPDDRINLGENVWLQGGADGRVFLHANGRQLALLVGEWRHPAESSDHISPEGTNAWDPRIAMDNEGNAILVWKQMDGSIHEQIFKSEYRDGVWTHPVGLSDNISPDGHDANNPYVAMDNNGNAIIVWQQHDGTVPAKYQIFKSEYRGGAWTHPVGLSDNISPDGQSAQNPKVAMDDNGNAIIVWNEYDGSRQQIFKSEYRGGVWTHPTGLLDNISPDGSAAEFPHVAMDNNGNAIIVWHQSDGSKNQIFMSEYRKGTWTYPGSIMDNISPDGQNALGAQAAMDNNGNALIVWSQADGSTVQIFMSEYRDGVWTHPKVPSHNISPDGQSAGAPRVAMDDNGNAIIAWQQSDGSKFQIFKSEYRSGVWRHPADLFDNISPDGQDVWIPHVSMDKNGNVIIVWEQSDGANDQIFKSEYRGGIWTHPGGLSDNISPDGQDAASPQAAMSNNGKAIICWRQPPGGIYKSEYQFGF